MLSILCSLFVETFSLNFSLLFLFSLTLSHI
jgi:hypothetical protein